MVLPATKYRTMKLSDCQVFGQQSKAFQSEFQSTQSPNGRHVFTCVQPQLHSGYEEKGDLMHSFLFSVGSRDLFSCKSP